MVASEAASDARPPDATELSLSPAVYLSEAAGSAVVCGAALAVARCSVGGGAIGLAAIAFAAAVLGRAGTSFVPAGALARVGRTTLTHNDAAVLMLCQLGGAAIASAAVGAIIGGHSRSVLPGFASWDGLRESAAAFGLALVSRVAAYERPRTGALWLGGVLGAQLLGLAIGLAIPCPRGPDLAIATGPGG